jgi:hypothetical protein
MSLCQIFFFQFKKINENKRDMTRILFRRNSLSERSEVHFSQTNLTAKFFGEKIMRTNNNKLITKEFSEEDFFSCLFVRSTLLKKNPIPVSWHTRSSMEEEPKKNPGWLAYKAISGRRAFIGTVLFEMIEI